MWTQRIELTTIVCNNQRIDVVFTISLLFRFQSNVVGSPKFLNNITFEYQFAP